MSLFGGLEDFGNQLVAINAQIGTAVTVGKDIQSNVGITFGHVNDLLKSVNDQIPSLMKEVKRLKGIERDVFNLVLMISITLAIVIFALFFYVFGKLQKLLS